MKPPTVIVPEPPRMTDPTAITVPGDTPGPSCTSCRHLFTRAEFDALPTIGIVPVPEDPSACDCTAFPPVHEVRCAARAYKLRLVNCPHCKSTLGQEIRP